MRLVAALMALGFVGSLGCSGAPSDPTWYDDVKPILVANCIKCHGADARGGAPNSFRLDRAANDGIFTRVRGASQVAQFIHIRTDAEQMPPVTRLSSRQIDILRNWADNPQLGTPPADNAAPEAEAIIESAGETVTFDLLITDDDFDTVDGNLVAVGPGGAIPITTALRGGQQIVDWRTESVPEGVYQIQAELSDEAAQPVVDLGEVTIAHAGGNTLPLLAILSPAPKSVLSDAESPLDVRLLVNDPDAGDLADVTLAMVRGDDRIELALARGLAITGNDPQNAHIIPIDTTAVPEGPNWTLVAEAGPVSTQAGSIVIGHGAPVGDFAPIQNILNTYCLGCHGGAAAAFPVFPLALDEVDVFDFRGGYYTRVVGEESMPPRSAEIILEQERMPAADRETLRQWLLTAPNPGGAP